MAAPTNGTCATAINVTNLLPYSVVVDTTLASTDVEVTPSCDALGGAKAVWWKISNSSVTNYTLVVIDTAGTNYYQDISVWTGACGGLTQLVCNNHSYTGNDFYVTFAAAPGQTYFILILDDDTGSGGSLHLSITTNTLVDNNLILANTQSSSSHAQDLTAFDSNGTFIAYDVTLSNAANDFPNGGIVQRPSDNFLIGAVVGGGPTKSTIYVFSPSMGKISSTLIDPPNLIPTLGWKPAGLYFDKHNHLFMLWRSVQGGVGSHCFDQIDPITFTLVQRWLTFDAVSFLGGNIVGGAVSPDGSKFYYGWSDSGQSNRNIIRVLNLTTGTSSNFATYGTWNEGTSTGYFTYLHCFRTDSDGNVYVGETHLTGGVADGGQFAKYNSSGLLLQDHPITGAHLVYSITITADTQFIWAIGSIKKLEKYQISDGTRIFTSTLSDSGAFGDLFVLGITPTPPPPTQDLSGIYYLKIGKTNDTYYTNLTSGTTIDVKIPNPFADTALLGDE